MLEIVTVCSHNRTRSVIAMAELAVGFERRVGPGVVSVESFGFGAEDLPAIDATVKAMRRRGIDVSGHRSRRATPERLGSADLILTAERDHVMRIAGMSETAYRRSFTLPEFLGLAASRHRGAGQDVGAWVEELSSSRTARSYLGDASIDVEDPTGSSRRRFEAAVSEIGAMCAAVVDVLVGPDGVGRGHRAP